LNRGKGYNLILTWGPPVFIASAIFLISAIPGKSMPEHPEIMNVLAHLIEYLVLAYMLARSLRLSGSVKGKLWLFIWTVIICGLFGSLDELHQFTVPNRMFDFFDIATDVIGSISGTFLFIVLNSDPAVGKRLVEDQDG